MFDVIRDIKCRVINAHEWRPYDIPTHKFCIYADNQFKLFSGMVEFVGIHGACMY